MASILFLHTFSTPKVGQKFMTFFLKVIMWHIKLKEKEGRPTYKEKNFDLTHSRISGVGLKGQHFQLYRYSRFFIELNHVGTKP